jgi:hypothetical protein
VPKPPGPARKPSVRWLEELEDEWELLAVDAFSLADRHGQLLGQMRSKADTGKWPGWDSLLADTEQVAASAERLLAHDVAIARHYAVPWRRIADALGQKLPTVHLRYTAILADLDHFNERWLSTARNAARVRRGEMLD